MSRSGNHIRFILGSALLYNNRNFDRLLNKHEHFKRMAILQIYVKGTTNEHTFQNRRNCWVFFLDQCMSRESLMTFYDIIVDVLRQNFQQQPLSVSQSISHGG